MDYEEMKLECLRIAGGDIEQARKLYDFCRGRGEDRLAMKPYVLENSHVTVHGKDSDLGKFTDYVKDPNIKF